MKSNFESKIHLEKEKDLKRTKLNNIIVFNVPESEGEISEAYERDVKKIQQIFHEKIGLKIDDLKDMYRKKIKDKGSSYFLRDSPDKGLKVILFLKGQP